MRGFISHQMYKQCDITKNKKKYHPVQVLECNLCSYYNLADLVFCNVKTNKCSTNSKIIKQCKKCKVDF